MQLFFFLLFSFFFSINFVCLPPKFKLIYAFNLECERKKRVELRKEVGGSRSKTLSCIFIAQNSAKSDVLITITFSSRGIKEFEVEARS